MSNVSTVYDTLLSTIAALFPTHTRIPNASSVQDNQIHLVRKGYGLYYAGSNQVDGEFNQFVVEHTFSVVCTREVIRTDSQTTQIDSASKELLEDAYVLQKDFYNVDEMGIGPNIRQLRLGNVSEISDITVDKTNFKTITVNFLISIAEDL